MEKQYWHVRCKSCDKQLRLTVSESDRGRRVEATCPECGTKTLTMIGVEIAKQSFGEPPPEVEAKIRHLLDRFAGDEEAQRIIHELQTAGVALSIAIEAFGLREKPEQQVTPKVDETGSVAFSEADDEAFRKTFKIKLNDD